MLASLSDGEPLRWSELRRRAEGVSEKMLAQTLRASSRTASSGATRGRSCPRTSSTPLTPLGQGLVERLVPLMAWIAQHADAMLARSDDRRTTEDDQHA